MGVTRTKVSHQRRPPQEGVDRSSQGAGALAVHDPNFPNALRRARLKVGGNQLTQIRGLKRMKIEFARDRQRHRRFRRIGCGGRRTHGVGRLPPEGGTGRGGVPSGEAAGAGAAGVSYGSVGGFVTGVDSATGDGAGADSAGAAGTGACPDSVEEPDGSLPS